VFFTVSIFVFLDTVCRIAHNGFREGGPMKFGVNTRIVTVTARSTLCMAAGQQEASDLMCRFNLQSDVQTMRINLK